MVSSFIEAIQNKKAVVGVVGMGYVGLPLALRFVESGFHVLGFDIDKTKVAALNDGESYIKTIPPGRVWDAVNPDGDGRLVGTDDFNRVRECDAILLCVPTPLNANREPDMSYVVNTCESVGARMRKHQLVVLESTTYPGTTDGIARETLEKWSGLVAGRDFWLAYSPEREDPGNPKFDTRTIPKVVGGLTMECLAVAGELYSAALDRVVQVRDMRVAEMTKLLENIFRSVNIALVNELKMVCDAMGIDVWEVIEAASSKPFGFMPFYPGPGLGGHCIPIDPFYLTWKAREYGLSTRFIELAGEVNTAMPHYVVHRLAGALNEAAKPLKGSRVLILGVAYKRDVDDVRESPALEIIKKLREAGSIVNYHDPYVPQLGPTRHYDFDLDSVDLDEIRDADAVVIVTDHSCIDYDRVVRESQLVIDTRNATRGLGGRANVVKA